MKELNSGQEGVSLKIIEGLVLFFFFLSGIIGLTHEIVWTRLLRLVMGNTVFSVTTVLCAFMGGLAVGSYIAGKFIDRRPDPLRIYGLLEGAVGIYCFLLPWIIKATLHFYRFIYQNYRTSFYLFSLIRFVFCATLLLPAAIFMGATLPVLSKFFVRASDRIGWTIGKIYTINTFGAGLGAILAGFLFIPAWGVNKTIYMACLVNLFICFCVFVLHHSVAAWEKHGAVAHEIKKIKESSEKIKGNSEIEETKRRPHGNLKIFLIGYAFSGFAALVYEIAWTRVLTLIIGSSVYAFSLLLAAFILGLALGSMIFSRFIDQRKNLVLFLALVEIAIGFSALLVVPLFGRLPLFVVGSMARLSHSFWLLQAAEFSLIFLFMLLPTTLMGAAFPLACRIYTQTVGTVGSSVGKVYTTNTSGSILGAFIGAFLLIPWLGIQKTIVIAALINCGAGCVFLVLGRTGAGQRKEMLALISAAVMIIGVAVFSFLLPAWNVDLMSSGVYLKAADFARLADGSKQAIEEGMKKLKVLFHKEGVSTTITVKEDDQGCRYFLVNGKGDASSGADMPTQELLAHIPMLLHPSPKSVLVIGLASGVTLGSAGLYPVEQLDCAEISPTALEAARYFDTINYHILDDSRVEIILEDGRNHLTLTDKKYDVIISEPSNPWIAGVADLFTREFFQLCRQRLNSGGVVCAWIHAYKIRDETFRSIIATFYKEFPHVTMWESSLGVDYLLIGSANRISLDYASLLKNFMNEGVRKDFKRIGIDQAEEFPAHFLMDEAVLKEYLGDDVPIHTDDNALVEFSAPRALYLPDDRIPLMETINRFRGRELSFLTCSGDKAECEKGRSETGRLIKAKKHVTNGHIYLARGREDLALAEFKKTLSLNPKEFPTVKGYVDTLIHAYQEKGQFAQAERLKKILTLDPQQKNVHHQLGLALYQRGEWDQALKEFQLGLASCESADGYYQTSLVLYQKKELEKAIETAQKALEIDPEYVEVWHHLGNMYLADNDFHAAVLHYEKAIDLDPDFVAAYINLGTAYTHKGQMEKAIENLNMALRLDPESAEAYNNLGSIYLGQGKYDQAGSAFKHALDINPDYTKALLNSGILSIRSREFQKAEQLFHQVLTLDRACAEGYSQLGYLYLFTEKYDQAISSFKRLMELQPHNPHIHYYSGKAYMGLGQIEAAIAEWQKALLIQPDLAAARLDLGNAYFETGAFQKASQEWEIALEEKQVDIPSHLVNLGLYYFQSTRYNMAIQAWQKAKEKKSDDPGLYYQLGLAYFQQGQFQEAALELEKSLQMQPDSQPARQLWERINLLSGDQ